MPSEERHFLLRIREIPSDDRTRLLVEVEAQVDHGAIYPAGRVDIDLNQLSKLQLRDGNEYGRFLGQRISSCLPIKAAISSMTRNERVRIQLMLEPPDRALAAIRWERLELSSVSENTSLARSYNTPFSRFASVNLPESMPPSGQAFHLLFIVSSPDGVDLIDASAELDSLLAACGDLLASGWMRMTVHTGFRSISQETRSAADARGIKIVDGPCTKEEVAASLHSNPAVHALHILAHGAFVGEDFNLFLENETGELTPTPSSEMFTAWPLQDMRLVVLQSCQSAESGTAGQQTQGFMQELLEAGVPGVVAMRDKIRMDDARNFCAAFYASLIRDGRADQAVNRGRAAIEDRGDSAWSIPIFGTRLVNASVWVDSPLVRAQDRLESRITENWTSRQFRDLPIDVLTMERASLEKQTRRDADEFRTLDSEQTAFRMDAFDALRQCLKDDEQSKMFTCIVGERGRAKKQLLEWLFLESRKVARTSGAADRICVMLHIADCSPAAYDPETTLARAIAAFYQSHTDYALSPQVLINQFQRDKFIFLIHADDNVGHSISEGLALLNDFSKISNHDRHRFVLTLDTNLLRISQLPAETRCLLVQPMKQERVRKFLSEAAEGSPDRRLLTKLENSALFDLAEVPWLLNEMLGQERRNILGSSRTAIIGRVVSDGISRFTGTRASAVRLREALQRFAWVVQNRRDYFLKGPEAYEILQQLRGNRDYPLFGLLTDMVNSCNVLAAIGDDGVGFNYPGFRTYCAAEYLALQPAELRESLLQDITAQLGRVSRAAIWNETLMFLAGLWSETSTLLSMILSGSLLHQGEQIFIAARCLAEARLSFANAPGSDEPIVQSILGALLQIASPGSRSVQQKVRAIRHIGPLKEKKSISPMLSLVFERTRVDKCGGYCLEFSGVRMAAIKSLNYLIEDAQRAIGTEERWKNLKQGSELLQAWVDRDSDCLSDLLTNGEEPVASAAAMMLAISRSDSAADMLINRFDDPEMSSDTVWAVTDALLEVSDLGLTDLVHRMLYREDRHEMLAYMIGKIGRLQEGTEEIAFLETHVSGPNEVLAGRCLQSLAELGDVSYLPLCHKWLREKPLSSSYYVLQALRSIGNWESLSLLEQKSWSEGQLKASESSTIDALRLEVYETIYWRLVGGMSRETMAPANYSNPVSK